MKVAISFLAAFVAFTSAMDTAIGPNDITKKLAPIIEEIECVSSTCLTDTKNLCQYKNTIRQKLGPCITKCKIDEKTLDLTAAIFRDTCP
ncbi:hypothetical protein HJFPF1_13242 [Paramyrothecium foliicola]|nr:hypothetical protein HJFPF1_13242 [Paramyrothecium foliicola]